jgi:hypothetical protein
MTERLHDDILSPRVFAGYVHECTSGCSPIGDYVFRLVQAGACESASAKRLL